MPFVFFVVNPSAMNRRRFLHTSLAASLALGAAPYVLRAQQPGRKLRTALIGSGWWGKNVLKEAIASERCQVVGLCDVASSVLEVAGDQVNDLNGDKPQLFADHRELLAKAKPEVVIIATPDHWHALQTIDAVKAGAHVYVEKPTGHTINESRAMLKAARDTGQLVQVGMHRRVGPHHVAAMKFLKSGAVGEVGMVRLFADSGGGREKPTANSKPPEGLDWDRWCGPAPLRPFNSRIHPGGWRNFLDFANGTLGDWGPHWLDHVLWWNDGQPPRSVYCTGGRSIAGPAVCTETEQTTDAPDHQVAVYEFENFTCTWEHRKFGGNATEKHSIGAYFYGTKGVLHIGWRDGWTFYPANNRDKIIHEDSQLQEPDGHNIQLLWADFVAAIDAKRQPTANIEVGHRASVLPLLGMLSWKLGRSIQWDGAKEQIIGDEKATALLSRPYRKPWEYPVG